MSALLAMALSIQLHGLSYHFDREPAHNERNFGAGIRYAIDDAWSLQAGAYNNSESKVSAYALADWTPLRAGAVSAGGFLGLATGYQWEPLAGRLTPIAGAVVRASLGRFSVALRVVPPHPKATSVAALEIGWRFT